MLFDETLAWGLSDSGSVCRIGYKFLSVPVEDDTGGLYGSFAIATVQIPRHTNVIRPENDECQERNNIKEDDLRVPQYKIIDITGLDGIKYTSGESPWAGMKYELNKLYTTYMNPDTFKVHAKGFHFYATREGVMKRMLKYYMTADKRKYVFKHVKKWKTDAQYINCGLLIKKAIAQC